jgi:hypothetical protein
MVRRELFIELNYIVSNKKCHVRRPNVPMIINVMNYLPFTWLEGIISLTK